MRPQTRELSAVAISDPILVDYQQQDFKLALQLDFQGGTATASVQTTMDDPYADYATDFNTNATWFDVTDLAAVSANAQGNVFFPIRAVRLNVTAFTSGPVKLTALQSNAPG